MLFNSIDFIIFFPIVVILYFSIPYKYRWILLLAASYYFYMCWKAEYIILIAIATLINYFAGLMMGNTSEESKRRKYLLLGLFGSLSILFGFKYFNFFNESLRTVFNNFNIFYNVSAFHVLLPVGISFYTFQALSYTIDVYRGDIKPEKHLGIFALYVSFFPQLVAGPIERSRNLLPQFFEKHDFDYQNVTEGLKIMLWGFFKKIVIADRLALYVNQVYNNPADHTGLSIWLATYFFAFQIYCDFSGYSDIAIGAAQVMGYRIMTNFDRPYFSKSIIEFWRRWHISLSTWFRDYLFIPLNLQLRNFRSFGIGLSVFITFLLCGLWHGANWTFILWGCLHGVFLISSHLTQEFRVASVNFFKISNYPNLHKVLQVLITFHLVFFSWIFFRANSIYDVFILLNNMFRIDLDLYSLKLSLTWYEISIAIAFILFMESIHFIQIKKDISQILSFKSIWVRWAFYYLLFFAILIFGQFNQTQFIYFQF